MKQVISIIIVLILLCSSLCAFAKGRDKHDADLSRVLLGEKSQEDFILKLEEAAYLTIDQMRMEGNDELLDLENSEYGISGLPSIEEINVSDVGKHRTYSHRGWDSKYRKDDDIIDDPKWQKKWEKRKSVLEITVNSIFEFNWWKDIPFIRLLPTGDKGQMCDSFCALIYYVHLLGDHSVTDSVKQYEYLIPVGGKLNPHNIIDELLYHIHVLFDDQEGTYEFMRLESELGNLNIKYGLLGRIDDRNIEKNKEYAKQLLQILQDYIPTLLSEEDFFKNRKVLQNAA